MTLPALASSDVASRHKLHVIAYFSLLLLLASQTTRAWQLDDTIYAIDRISLMWTINLPGRFSHRPVSYRWQDPKSVSSRPCVTAPSVTQEDQSDYRAFGLSPGVKVVGKSLSTSSGVLIESSTGIQRLTLADHRFHDADEV
jgi:hypothetical protein